MIRPLTILNPGYVGFEQAIPAFSPQSLNPRLWLDAADASTITLVNGAVSQWNDKSGNVRHATQTTAANRPAYESGQGVVFGNSMSMSGIVNPLTSFTVFYVGTTDPAAGKPRSFYNGTYGTDGHGFYHATNYGTIVSGTNGGTFSASIAVVNKPQQFCLTGADTTYTFYINGTSGVSGSVTLNTPTGSYVLGGTSVGNDMGGTLNEVIYYVGSLTNAQRKKVEGYLAWKWGLVSSLPANHTYKTVAP